MSDIIGLITTTTAANPSAVTTSSNGTTNTIPKFTAAQTIANSSVTDNGTTLATTDTTLNIGQASGTSAVLGLLGGTSGTATLTAPAVAGTPSNPILSSNQLSWPTGLGAITHIQGPTDQTFLISGGQAGGTVTLQTQGGGTNIQIQNNVNGITLIGQAIRTGSGAKFTLYNNIATAGQGFAPIYGATSQKSESALDNNVLTYTPPAVAGTYRIRFTMAVSAQNTATLGWTATWKDSNGSAQAPTNLALFTSGVAAPALTITAATNGVYYGDLTIDIDNSATAIVVKLTFTGTTFTAKVSATIEQLQ